MTAAGGGRGRPAEGGRAHEAAAGGLVFWADLAANDSDSDNEDDNERGVYEGHVAGTPPELATPPAGARPEQWPLSAASTAASTGELLERPPGPKEARVLPAVALHELPALPDYEGQAAVNCAEVRGTLWQEQGGQDHSAGQALAGARVRGASAPPRLGEQLRWLASTRPPPAELPRPPEQLLEWAVSPRSGLGADALGGDEGATRRALEEPTADELPRPPEHASEAALRLCWADAPDEQEAAEDLLRKDAEQSIRVRDQFRDFLTQVAGGPDGPPPRTSASPSRAAGRT